MTSTSSDSPFKIAPIQYSAKTIARAERAMRCSPFHLALFVAMRQQSVRLRAIAGKAGSENGYTSRSISELAAENYLLWLIQVGLLRREVDGQGLTDSFRLTPLGYCLIERQQAGSLAEPSFSDRLYNSVSRWVRSPL